MPRCKSDHPPKPTVFIGSSTEGLAAARLLKDSLEPELEVVLWNENLFELGEDTLTSLLKFVSVFDFGVFVLGADDLVKSRTLRGPSPRDNVVFELGLFMGALGRRRAFPVILPPKKGKLKLPSDLLGNTETRIPYTFRTNPTKEALHDSADQLRKNILERSENAYLQLLPSTGLAVGYFKNFLAPVCSILVERDVVEVGGKVIDISGDNFDFNIVLPVTLAGASREAARRFVKDRGLIDLNLSGNGAGRPYPFYVEVESCDQRLQLYDYPTTLAASHRAIEITLASGFLGQTNHQRILEDKEIANFQRTLQILLREPDAAEFRKNVHFTKEP